MQTPNVQKRPVSSHKFLSISPFSMEHDLEHYRVQIGEPITVCRDSESQDGRVINSLIDSMLHCAIQMILCPVNFCIRDRVIEMGDCCYFHGKRFGFLALDPAVVLAPFGFGGEGFLDVLGFLGLFAADTPFVLLGRRAGFLTVPEGVLETAEE